MIIFALVMNSQLKNGLRHYFFVDAFKLKKCFVQEIVHVGAVVADIDQHFPRLKHLVYELKMFKAKAILQNVVRRQLDMSINL
jgi:hypothetical protein